jgi:hypothetical protein
MIVVWEDGRGIVRGVLVQRLVKFWGVDTWA